MRESAGECFHLRGGRVVDPAQNLDAVADLWIAGGRVAGLGPAPGAGPWTVIDVAGLCVCPGLVDVHVHLREPGQEWKETIATGTRAAVAGGYTTVCCMPNTIPPVATPQGVADVQARAARGGVCRVRVIGAIEGAGPGGWSDAEAMAQAGCVALTDDAVPLQDDARKADAWVRSANAGLPLVVHCEDLALSRRGALSAGPVAEELGVSAQDPAAEAVSLRGWLAAARGTGQPGRLHVAHVSTAGALAAAATEGGRYRGLTVSMETAPHYLALTDEAVTSESANAKMNPPLRTERDRAALRAAVVEGVVGVIATDHAPHAAAEKAAGIEEAPFGVVGLETAVGVVLTELYHTGAMALVEVIRRMSTGPARALGLAGAGTLLPGTPADITILDLGRGWNVDPARFASKGRNTPFAGKRLMGQPWGAVVAGRFVSRECELLE